MKGKLTLILTSVFISIGFLHLLETPIYSQNKPLTLGQVSTSLNVSNDKKKESAITAKKVRQVGVTFPLTPEIETELRDAGATNELIEAIRQNSPPLPSQTKQSKRTAEIIEIIVEKANLRESPNASSKIIREVAIGERFILSDIQPVGAWYKVVEIWTGKEGWLHGNTFKMVTVNSSNNPKTFKNSIGMEFVYIPNGSFDMGSNEGGSGEKPVHRVTISKGFYIGKYEVTQEEYQKLMGTNPSQFKNCPRCPVETVSWDDTQDFIKKLNAKNEGIYRLPTEAEWEYAARAGTTTTWSFGNDENRLGDYAWYDVNSRNKTHEVGTKQANDFGLYDMHGNVWEWTQDWYGSYQSGNVTDPTGADSASNRVVRGGCWLYGAVFLRSAFRNSGMPSFSDYILGFRVVRQ